MASAPRKPLPGPLLSSLRSWGHVPWPPSDPSKPWPQGQAAAQGVSSAGLGQTLWSAETFVYLLAFTAFLA